jgi:hypothetical protein
MNVLLRALNVLLKELWVDDRRVVEGALLQGAHSGGGRSVREKQFC